MRLADQEHDGQTRPLQLIEHTVRQPMERPGHQHGIHLRRFDDLQKLVSRQTLGDDLHVVEGIECWSQTLLQLLIAQPEGQAQTRRAEHHGTPFSTARCAEHSRARTLDWR
jgi:hypothetical protein